MIKFSEFSEEWIFNPHGTSGSPILRMVILYSYRNLKSTQERKERTLSYNNIRNENRSSNFWNNCLSYSKYIL